MFKFVTKKEYWEVEDSSILDDIIAKPNFSWHLKSIQDAIAYSYLNEYYEKMIAEIGGGNSRLLPTLAEKNTCYNIEEFKGVGGGPKKEICFQGVTNIHAQVGDFSNAISKEQFDAVFSVSVVEHVPNDKLSDFFKDCHRILKPTGVMIHLIDVYLEDAEENNKGTISKITSYGSFLDMNHFAPLLKPEITTEKDMRFSTSFATNPDNVMNEWNRIVPQLRNKRERAQSCTLLMIGRKVETTKEF